jgi:hypothetical protein
MSARKSLITRNNIRLAHAEIARESRDSDSTGCVSSETERDTSLAIHDRMPALTLRRAPGAEKRLQDHLFGAGKIGGKEDMVYEQWMIVLLMALCVLEGLVFIEVRRLRLGKGPK